MKEILGRCRNSQEILFQFYFLENAPFELINLAKDDRKADWICLDIFDSERPSITQMWQLLIDYVYLIIHNIRLWLSVWLLITNV